MLGQRRHNGTALAFTSSDELQSHQETGKTDRGEVSDRRVQASWRHYARLLQECAQEKSLEEGKKVHDRMRRQQIKPDTYLSNMLISMYAKCGSIEEAHKVFQAMVDKDVVSWNAMISGFAMHGQGQEAVDHYYQMQREGVKPNKNTFVSILSAVNSPTVLAFGEQLHRTITRARLEADVTVASALISMYCKCGSTELARTVFDQMQEPNVVSWTAMIAGYAQQGQSKEAFALFDKLIRSGIQPNKISYAGILGACTSPNDLEQGEKLHGEIKRAGLEQDLLVGNALISMYARCGSFSNARQVFDNMRSLNRISWNAMISGCGESQLDEAFRLYKRMQQKKIQPDRFTYASLLSICADIDRGKELHSQITRSGWHSDVHVATALISMYTKCGRLDEARKVFNEMPERNVVSWNAFIAACCRHGNARESLQIFKQMRSSRVAPDHITFITLLNACITPEALEDGRNLHKTIAKWGMLSRNDVANALISMYGRCGSLPDAREVFYRIVVRDLGSWNAMMAAMVQQGANEAAYELFNRFRGEKGRPDKYTFMSALKAVASLGDLHAGRKVHALVERRGMGDDVQILTSLIRMYSKCGSLDDACKVFNNVPEGDVGCWNAMLAAYVRSNQSQDALDLFQHMQSVGVKPNKATYASVLDACGNLGALEQGKTIHSQLKETDIRISNALIEMYMKSGCSSSATKVFNTMSKRYLYSWNALIAGLSQNGHPREALRWFERMSISPNKATFTSVLSSHAHLGEVEEAFTFLESIKENYQMEPTEDHFAAMVSALGREGLLMEAEEFINELSLESKASLWESLLVACRVHGNVELAETAAVHVLNAGSCEQLLSLYSAAGRWGDFAALKATMEETGMMVPNRCTIELNSELHTFETTTAGEDPDEKLKKLVDEMTVQGFVLPDDPALLFSRSAELLAVAYALQDSPPGTPIRCVTDSRVADLSHKMLQFVSRVYRRDIFVRDPCCCHNFRPGFTCSCGDYW